MRNNPLPDRSSTIGAVPRAALYACSTTAQLTAQLGTVANHVAAQDIHVLNSCVASA